MQTPDRWILLEENRSAHEAVERVLACVGAGGAHRTINPLYLHGPPGTGKTHLVADLVEQLTRSLPAVQIALLPAREIPTAPTRAATADATAEEIKAVRQADVVIIEDLQHLPARAVEPFVQLLDRCLSRQRQLVCTATVGPGQLPDIPGRLTSRLGQGLVVGLELLGQPSRRAYLQQRQGTFPSPVSADVLDWLAEHMPGSARQLEGALVRLGSLVKSFGRAPTLPEVTAAFREDSEAGTPTVERIARQVGHYFQVEPQQMRSRLRRRETLLARQVCMYLTRQLTSLSLAQIGAYFGEPDHSTVLHACQKVEQALSSDASLNSAVRALRADLA